MNNQNNSIEQQEQSSQALSIVKLQFNGEKRRFPLEKISMQSLMECVTTVGGAHLPKTARIRYIDDEKDLISFSTDEELKEAFKTCAPNNVLRVVIDVC